MNVTLMRHGTLDNPDRRFIGSQDVPLSARGRLEALFWRREWQDVPFAGAVCSDLSRCRETVGLVLGDCACPVFLEPRFREISLGAWEGLTRQDVERRFPGAFARRGADFAHFRPDGGESFADLAARVVPAFAAWQTHFGERPFLLVAHAGVLRVLLARFMALPLARVLEIPVPYGCAIVMDGRAEPTLPEGLAVSSPQPGGNGAPVAAS